MKNLLRWPSLKTLAVVSAFRTFAFCLLPCAFAPAASAQERLPLGTHVGSNVAVPSVSSGSSSYEDGGRRDPFVSLLVSKKPSASASPTRVVQGLAGVALADIAVKGIVHTGATIQAVLEGPGGKSFVARTKDRLQDATVKTIDGDGVVFAERVVDALGAVHSRDVRKSLRIMTEGDR